MHAVDGFILVLMPACLPAMEMGSKTDWENNKIEFNAEIQLTNHLFLRNANVLAEQVKMGPFDVSEYILFLGLRSIFLFCFMMKPSIAEDLTLNFAPFQFSG